MRAVRTASLCREVCRAADLSFGIGVTTGRAFCGAYGSPLRREYTMLGDSVNLAARLMQAAPNDVWVDAATLREAVGRIAFAELPPVRVKGKAELVSVATPLGDLDATGRHEVLLTGRHEAVLTGRLDATQTGSLDSPSQEATGGSGEHSLSPWGGPAQAVPRMVGREREQRRLTQHLDALDAGGATSAVLVVAEPGMGKSLLAATLHAEAARRRIATALGAAEPSSTADAFHPFREVFPQLLGLAPGRTHAETRATVEIALASEPALLLWAPLLEPALPAGWEDNATTGKMTGATRSDALRQLLLHLLTRATAESPRLIVLDDAQWMDASSWGLLLAAMPRVPGLLFLVLTRPLTPEPAEAIELLQHPGAERLDLGPLPTPALRALVARRIGVAELPPGIGEAITLRAEGNPYFAEELAWALLDSGQVVVERGVCRLRPGSRATDLELPDTLQSAVTARLDRLAPGEGLAAKVASVIGRQFGWRLLVDVYPVEEDRVRLRGLIEALVAQGILNDVPEERESAWFFRHGLVQETAYSLLPFVQRRRLHRAVAAWLEAHHGDDEGRIAAIALHWRRADELGRAIEAYEVAGRRAVRRGANREAIVLLDDALQIAAEQDARGETSATPLRRGRWRFGQGEAYMQAGEMPAAKERFGAALTLLGVSLPRSPLGWVLRLFGEALLQVALRMVAGRRATAAPQHTERLALVARTASMYGGVCYFTIEPLQWLTASLIAVNRGERAGDDAPAAQALGSLGNIVGTLRLQSAARAYFARGQSAQEVRDQTVVAWTEAVFELTYCRWTLLDAVLDRGITLGRSVSDAYTLGVGLTVQAIGAWLRGHSAEALRLHDEVLVSARERGNIEHLSWSLTFGVPARLELGRGDEVRAHLEEARGLLTRLDPFTRVVYEGVRAQALSRDGRHGEALDAVVEMIARFKEHGAVLYTYLPALGGAAEALIAAAHAERHGQTWTAANGATWRRLGGRLQRIFASAALMYVYFRPRRHLLRGSLRAARGKRRGAERAWRAAERSAQHLGLPGEAALVSAERVRFGHDG